MKKILKFLIISIIVSESAPPVKVFAPVVSAVVVKVEDEIGSQGVVHHVRHLPRHEAHPYILPVVSNDHHPNRR